MQAPPPASGIASVGAPSNSSYGGQQQHFSLTSQATAPPPQQQVYGVPHSPVKEVIEAAPPAAAVPPGPSAPPPQVQPRMHTQLIENFKSAVEHAKQHLKQDPRKSRPISDIEKRIQPLYEKLSSGMMPGDVVEKLGEYMNAIGSLNGNQATHVYQHLAQKVEWGVIPTESMQGMQRLAKALS